MTARISDGRAIARGLETEAAEAVAALAGQGPIRLVAVSAVERSSGDDASDPSAVYLASQSRVCRRVGIRFRHDRLAPGATQDALHTHLRSLSSDPRVTGVILQLPLPPGLDARKAQCVLDPRKDVEGVHPENLGLVTGGRGVLIPCTAAAAVHILEVEGITLRGAECVMVGHSEIVGKPASLLLLDRLATVTVCHIGTKDLAAHTRRADVILVAVGKPGLLKRDMVRKGAAVVDIGINVVGDKVVGDVAPDVAEVAALVTPVPGGVGPVTVGMLLRNTVRAARLQRGLPA